MKFEKYIDLLLSRKVFPGISVLAGSHNGPVFKKCYGNISIIPKAGKLEWGTIYDLASLTKPLITALLILMMIESGELKEDSPIDKFLDGFEPGITISNLITHTSGLPAWYPLYLGERNHIRTIKGLKRNSFPGKKVVYSCLGYILLSEIIQKISGKGFAETAKTEIIDKLGLKDTFFNVPAGLLSRCAPTEKGNKYEKNMVRNDYPSLAGDYKWREHLLRREVNDGNSFFLKGNSGNAGLFSTADDIFILSREFYPDHSTILNPGSVKKFWKNLTRFRRSHRTFGFKLNSSFITSGGRSLSRAAIGHNGFTGTSIWMEPEPGNIFILLTNRIHPEVDPDMNFNKVRRKLHKLIKKDLGII